MHFNSLVYTRHQCWLYSKGKGNLPCEHNLVIKKTYFPGKKHVAILTMYCPGKMEFFWILPLYKGPEEFISRRNFLHPHRVLTASLRVSTGAARWLQPRLAGYLECTQRRPRRSTTKWKQDFMLSALASCFQFHPWPRCQAPVFTKPL